MNLLKQQQVVAKEHDRGHIFLEGVAGTGKTTAGIERIKHLIRQGVGAESIALIVPQATLALPYRQALRRARIDGNTHIEVLTLGKMAYQAIDLFWALIAEDVGFERPYERPHFLSLEMMQYYMMRFLAPLIEERDYFNSVHISRNRLYTQIADNLNKSALVGFSHEVIGERLQSAWRGDSEQALIYADTQACASYFREMCRQYNLLDFSLQVTLFIDYLWVLPPVRQYFMQKYRHLVVDNVEEDAPTTHSILHDWLPSCESALVIYDSEAGYRRFLGADMVTAYELKALCDVQVTLDNHRVMSEDVAELEQMLGYHLRRGIPMPKAGKGDARQAIVYGTENRTHPQMIQWVVDNIAGLVHNEGVKPKEIVVLAPYLPDALRFTLGMGLQEAGIEHRSHRPSRALREEHVTRALVTLAKIAHPRLGLSADGLDVSQALVAVVAGLDLIRARFLTDMLYREGCLMPFETIRDSKMQERITFELGGRYDVLQTWLSTWDEHDPEKPLDVFWQALFGEVLSQKDFGLHNHHEGSIVCANLIESAREFRQNSQAIEPELDTVLAYLRMVDEGVIANQYIRQWDADRGDGVLIAPAYTFLLGNQSVDYQFWLNVGSHGWTQRLLQPLTNPYVMSKQWEVGDIWTDEHEVEANEEILSSLVLGLIRRCRKQIYLGFSQFGEQGHEERGALLMAIQAMLRRLQKEGQDV